MAKIAIIVAAFLVAVVALGFLTAKINGIDLRKDEADMTGQELVMYGILRPLLAPARLVARLFRK